MKLNNHVFKGHRALLGTKYVTYGEVELTPKTDIFKASLSGFDWGNSTKGSTQLAFAMLYQLQGEEIAHKYTPLFRDTVIKNFQSRDWIYSAAELSSWVDANCEIEKPKKLKPANRQLTKKKTIKPKIKSNIVKEICKELNITQKNLAEILEIPEGTVSSWAVKNEIPRLGKKAIEFYMINVKNQKIVDSYKSFKDLLEAC